MGIEGKPEKQLQLQAAGKWKRKASDAMSLGEADSESSRQLYKGISTFLLLAALLAIVVYSLAVAAIVCRVRNWKQQQKLQQQQVTPLRNNTSISSSKFTGACHVNLGPVSEFLSASTVTIVIVNFVAALVLLESLMLLPVVNACGRPPDDRTRDRAGSVTRDEINCVGTSPQLGGTARESEAVKKTTATAFAVSDMEPSLQHTNDFILRLTYQTRCRDHLVIRVRLPTANTSSLLGFSRPTGLLNQTIPSAQLIHAKGNNRSNGEEQNAMRLTCPGVRLKTVADVERVNETETGSCERRAPRKSRAIH